MAHPIDADHVLTDGHRKVYCGWRFEAVGWMDLPLVSGPKTIAVCHTGPDRSATSRARVCLAPMEVIVCSEISCGRVTGLHCSLPDTFIAAASGAPGRSHLGR